LVAARLARFRQAHTPRHATTCTYADVPFQLHIFRASCHAECPRDFQYKYHPIDLRQSYPRPSLPFPHHPTLLSSAEQECFPTLPCHAMPANMPILALFIHTYMRHRVLLLPLILACAAPHSGQRSPQSRVQQMERRVYSVRTWAVDTSDARTTILFMTDWHWHWPDMQTVEQAARRVMYTGRSSSSPRSVHSRTTTQDSSKIHPSQDSSK
jgi:hypothetical protein